MTAVNSLGLPLFVCRDRRENSYNILWSVYAIVFGGRWIGTALMVKFRSKHVAYIRYHQYNIMLRYCNNREGIIGLYCMLGVSFFMFLIIMLSYTVFATIFKGLGDQTKSGSAFLVMAIVGNARSPEVYSLYHAP